MSDNKIAFLRDYAQDLHSLFPTLHSESDPDANSSAHRMLLYLADTTTEVLEGSDVPMNKVRLALRLAAPLQAALWERHSAQVRSYVYGEATNSVAARSWAVVQLSNIELGKYLVANNYFDKLKDFFNR